jgi:hypothetical protein
LHGYYGGRLKKQQKNWRDSAAACALVVIQVKGNYKPKKQNEKIMNKPNTNKKLLPRLMGLWAVAALAGALMLTTAGVASADYGQGALYQIELSANLNLPASSGGANTGGVPPAGGGGVWLWIALYPDGTGDAAGSDCGHGEGAANDNADVNWYYSDNSTYPCGITYPGGSIVITGVVLHGFGDFPTTISVPRTYGHYTGTGGSFLTVPLPPPVLCLGFSQLQVAP